MMAAAMDYRDFALTLHAFLRSIDPGALRTENDGNARTDVEALKARLAHLRGETEALESIGSLLDRPVPPADMPQAERKKAWEAWRKPLVDAYEGLVRELKIEAIHVPSLRPTNYKRNVFHAGNGLFVATIVLWVLPFTILRPMATGAVGLVVFLEVTRRIWPSWNDKLMAAFGPLAHPHEAHRVNSGTWYVFALCLLAWIGSKPIAVAAVLVLAFGDPAAAILGRRFGKTKIVNGRSLEGTIAFVTFGGIAAALGLAIAIPGAAIPVLIASALVAAIPGAIAELFSVRVDDNFSIPVAVAVGCLIGRSVFGLPF